MLAAPAASAADLRIAVDGYSAYVWRGMTLQDAPVLQPWLDLSGVPLGKGVSLGVNLWTNFPVSDAFYEGQLAVEGGAFSELATTVTLSLPKGFDVGFAEYTMLRTLAGRPADTGEAFVGWTGSFGVDVWAYGYYDVQAVDGFYLELGVAREFAIRPWLTTSLQVEAGAASRNFALACWGTRGGPFDYGVLGELSFAPSERIALGIRLGYVGSLDHDVLPEQPVSFYGGLTASIGF